MKKYCLLVFACIVFCNTLCAQTASLKDQIHEFRKEYKSDFLKEERSPFYNKEESLEKLRFYKAKNNYKVEARFERTKEATPFEMPTYSGKTKTFVKFGNLHFSIKGKAQKMAVYQNSRNAQTDEYKNYLFIPFKDITSNKSTYGGGRYMDVMIDDIENDKLILDFNKAYNPWCAFSGGYNCPIPPAENHLPIAIKAGEKKYAKAH